MSKTYCSTNLMVSFETQCKYIGDLRKHYSQSRVLSFCTTEDSSPIICIWKTRARVTPRAEEALTPDNFYN